MANDTPAAVASITLSDDERKRIAGELGLEESQYEAVPSKLDIARFEVEDDESDVEGFAMNAFVMRGAVSAQQPFVAAQEANSLARLNVGVGKIPGSILVPQ
jgi:hypothetical protein